MDLAAEASAAIPSIAPHDLLGLMGQDDVLIVDVRDHPDVTQTGKIESAIHVSRGMLEFQADEASPHFNAAFSKDKTIVLYCASGGRAALCGQALIALGYKDVRNLGAFGVWLNTGGPTQKV
jgi:rhodanese-related sulfurtransferase